MACLSIQLFGSFEIRRDGLPLPRPRSRTGQWLLTLLLLRAGREVEREWLAGMLWPESLPERALANLRRTLTDLRHLLGEEAVCLSAPTPHSLRLDLPAAQCDLLAFDAARQRGDPASLMQAVALYHGPLLEGCLEEWLLPERDSREQAYLQALETLAAQSSGLQAADYWRAVVLRDPMRETAQRRLLQALADAGDYAGMTQAYRRFRLFLHQSAQGEPASETAALYRRLRSAARLPAAKPPAGEPSSRRFPHPITALIGREEDTAQIAAMLDTARLVTLTGTGGIGKTRLAVHLVEELADDFAAGLWFIDLAPLTDPALVPRVIQETLSLRDAHSEASGTEVIAEFIGRKPLLLILDNCEHLLSACALLAEELLRRCPGLRLLATSRQPLGVMGEHLWPVPPLSPDDAAQLFAMRGGEGLPGFCLTAENAAAVGAICRRLDGIPLALEMAAARLRAMPVVQIAARLEEGFPLLTGTGRKALPRHQTLRAAMDWSYSLLSPAEQRLLQRLSVFAGGWTLESAEQVCGTKDSDAVNDLLSLVDQSLVLYSPESSRYRLLEPIREYAAEKLLESGKALEIRDRHLDCFLRMAEKAHLHLEGPAQAQWLTALQSEHDNVRAALVSSRLDGSRLESGLRLFAALIRYGLVRGHLSEGRTHGKALLAKAEAADASPILARALLATGHLALWQGDCQDAETLYARSLEISRSIQDDQRVAWSLSRLGCAAFLQGETQTARRYLEESLTLPRSGDTAWVISDALNILGAVACHEGEYDQAWRLCQEGLALRRALCDDHFIAASLRELARIALARGDLRTAGEYLQEWLAILRTLGDRSAAAMALDLAAALALADERRSLRDKFLRAARLSGAAASLRETIAARIFPIERAVYDQRVQEMRDGLGKEAFAAAWAEGEAMSLAENIALALHADDAL